MFTNAEIYDLVYSFKDYQTEADTLKCILEKHIQSGGRTLLDVACGTGQHLAWLKEDYAVEGLDLSAELLSLARQKHPEVVFHQADMIEFKLGKRFDAVVCLFSSIGYAKTLENAQKAVQCMSKHLKPGGVLAIEPWFTPDVWQPGHPHALLVERDDLKIARVNTSFAEGRLSWFDLHYLVGTPESTTHFMEHHELGLFTMEEMRVMMESAGLQTTYDEEGLCGRGLWIGFKHPEQ